MNILVLPSWYPTKDNKLLGSFFKEQVEALRENLNVDDKIVVLAFEAFSVLKIKNFIKSKKSEFFVENNIPTFYIRFINNRFIYKKSGRIIKKAIKRIENNLRIKFDLIHIHSALNAGIFYSLSKTNIPYIITEHATMFARGLINSAQKKCLPNVFNNAVEIIAVGNGLKKEINKYTNKNVEVVFNMVTSNIPTEHLIQKPNESKFFFFSLGFNAEKKGCDILLKAFSKILETTPNAFLTIGGLSETEIEWLTSIANKENLATTNYQFLPHLSRKDVFNYMSSCDAFVLLSRFETFGIVFVEAMHCGKPVIGTKTGGPDSFINDDVGITVSCENIEESAQAMKNMILNYTKYDSQKIKKYALDNFSPNVICNQIIKIYQSAIQSSKTKSRSL